MLVNMLILLYISKMYRCIEPEITLNTKFHQNEKSVANGFFVSKMEPWNKNTIHQNI